MKSKRSGNLLIVSGLIPKQLRLGVILIFLVLGVIFHVQGLEGAVADPSEEGVIDSSVDRTRNSALKDGVPFSEKAIADKGYSETPVDASLTVRACDDEKYEYMAASPYYKVFFKGTLMGIDVKDAWVEGFRLLKTVITHNFFHFQ